MKDAKGFDPVEYGLIVVKVPDEEWKEAMAGAEIWRFVEPGNTPLEALDMIDGLLFEHGMRIVVTERGNTWWFRLEMSSPNKA